MAQASLTRESIRALPSTVFRAFDVLAALAAKHADEAPDGMFQPTRSFPDLVQCYALRAFHQSDDFRLLVGSRFVRALSRRIAFLRLGRAPSSLSPRQARQPPPAAERRGTDVATACQMRQTATWPPQVFPRRILPVGAAQGGASSGD